MSRKKSSDKSMYDITPAMALLDIDTKCLFLKSYVEPRLSPIDQFFENTNKINLILANSHGAPTETMSTMLLLGYMSAVESYMRALFRGIINIDEVARKKSESLTVSFAAAMFHKKKLLPEALLESVSFSSKSNILDAMKNFIGISNVQDKDFVKALDEFAKVVEIRHCCVHRFGKLGSQNAQRLGFGDHSILLEKPFHPDENSLSQIANTIRSVVCSINSTIFKKIMERIAHNQKEKNYSFSMTWDLNSDKKYFKPYFDLFVSSSGSGSNAVLKEAYNNFRDVYLKNNASET